MNLPKLTNDLNIITTLSNRPTETAEELKAKFDEAGKIIKEYLNSTLLPNIEQGTDEDISRAIAVVEETISNLEDNVENTLNTTIESLQTEISETIKTLKEESLKSSSFELTSSRFSYTLPQASGGVFGTIEQSQTISKSGYIPLAIAGDEATYGDVAGAYLLSSNNGSAVVRYKINNPNTSQQSGTILIQLLWVKVS